MSETDQLFESSPIPNAAVSPDVAAAPKAPKTKLSVQLPYLATPGSIKTAFEKIRQASTPDRVTNDFIQNGLGMKGGNGSVITPFLKKIGLVASDGTPTDLYKQFRNPTLGGAAIASAIKFGYKPLAAVSEYFYKMSDKDLLNVILQVTGAEAQSSAARQILATIRALKEFANFDESAITHSSGSVEIDRFEPPHDFQPPPPIDRGGSQEGGTGLGLNLAYTINLNLPATADQSVFNAIFRSLKEHLLSND